jgi:hypothetical protein
MHRVPLGARPWLRVMLVAAQVSSINTRKPLASSLCIAWLLFPTFVLFLWEASIGLLLIAPAAAAALAICQQRLFATEAKPSAPPETTERVLFAAPPPAPSERKAALIASLCIYAAAIATVNQAIAGASFFLVICSFLLVSRWTATDLEAAAERKNIAPSGKRLATVALLAILVTWIALVPWLRTSAPAAGMRPGAEAAGSAPKHPPRHTTGDGSSDAYHAILLWPFPPKQPILPPVPRAASFHPGANADPLVIPFDGSYRYFQTPGVWLPSRAHVAHGSPLNVNIHSADWGPLLMEAHQQLGQPLNLACCREIQMAIRNGDNRPGRVLLGLVLTDSSLPGKPSQILAPQPVLSSQPGHFALKSAPQDETVSFAIPEHGKLRQFDEITVLFLPDPERSALGSKIAVHQFVLMPR